MAQFWHASRRRRKELYYMPKQRNSSRPLVGRPSAFIASAIEISLTQGSNARIRNEELLCFQGLSLLWLTCFSFDLRRQ